MSSSDFYPQQKQQPAKAFVGVGIDECIVRAISLFKSKEDAEKRLKLPKFRHSLIARVSLEPKDGLIKKTFSASHYSWLRSVDFEVNQVKIAE